MAQVLISCLFLSILLLVLSLLLSNKIDLDVEKSSPFECGFSPKSNSRMMFSLQFFLVTLIFLIFDIELILMFPFLGVSAFSAPNLTSEILLIIFTIVLSAGFVWEWSQSMLEWNKFK